MSENITNNPSVPSQVVAEVKFPQWVNNLGIIPTSYKDSMSYYETLAWLCKYLEETVISTVNQNGDAVEELQGLYIELNSYVTHYFDNLDVQTEINNKLDDMVEDGTLQALINNIFSSLQNQISAVASGSPAGVYDTLSDLETDDPDHSKIYVVLANGKWYYYDTTNSEWSAGGDYQTPIANFDKTLTGNNDVPDSKAIGDRINNYFYRKNYFDQTTINDNHQYGSSGNVSENNSMLCTTEPIPMKNGDKIFYYYDGTASQCIKRVIKCDNFGNFLSSASASTLYLWTADEDCFIKLNIDKTGHDDYLTKSALTINQPPLTSSVTSNYYFSTNENTEKNTIAIEDVTTQHNYFDYENSIMNGNIQSDGAFNKRTQNDYLTTNLIECKSGDVFRTTYFGDSQTTYGFYQVLKYNQKGQFTERASVSSQTYTCDFNGFLRFNMQKGATDEIDGHLLISKNELITGYFPHKKYINLQNLENEENVNITKVDSNNFIIRFGKFNIKLFKTDNGSTNQNNWNLKELKNGNDTLVPSGTDILGPVKINNNSDYIGGIHGDETTDDIKISINGETFDISEIENETGKSLTITMKSSVYDQDELDKAFDRFVTIIFENQTIHISNTYKASKNLTLKRATNGGLIACQNGIIDSIIFNNAYFDTVPTTAQNIESKYNTCATINTQYGSITVINIKGNELENYEGFLQVFTNEVPMRNKIYFDTYKSGSYSLTTGDLIPGEFVYKLS